MDLQAERLGQVGLGMPSPRSIPAGFMKSFSLAVVFPYLPVSSQLTKIAIYLFVVLGIRATKGFHKHLYNG